jgi:hypothetical protein
VNTTLLPEWFTRSIVVDDHFGIHRTSPVPQGVSLVVQSKLFAILLGEREMREGFFKEASLRLRIVGGCHEASYMNYAQQLDVVQSGKKKRKEK